MNHQTNLLEDKIDLFELWALLNKSKWIILSVTSLFSLLVIFYCLVTTPVYSGNILVEVGEIISTNESISVQPLDEIHTLKEIISRRTGLNITIPQGTSNILMISTENSDISKIESALPEAAHFIIDRHKEKAKFYETNTSKVRMTEVIGKVKISDKPVRPKKAVIITMGFVGGLILGIFLALFIEINLSKHDA